jgi:hypothetical protein
MLKAQNDRAQALHVAPIYHEAAQLFVLTREAGKQGHGRRYRQASNEGTVGPFIGLANPKIGCVIPTHSAALQRLFVGNAKHAFLA